MTKDKATDLHSKVIRLKGFCERCDESDYELLQAAHINRRSYSSTRTLLINAFCLCHNCHRWFTDKPIAFEMYIKTTWHGEIRDEVKQLAIQSTQFKTDWDKRVLFLRGIKLSLEQGILTLDEARRIEYDQTFSL